MKAWVLRGPGDLRPEDVPKPIPKDGEVLVRVAAAGVCSSDIGRVYGSGAYRYPIILGHEFAGVAEDGRRVGVFPLVPCMKCESCGAGVYETCSDYGYVGSRRDGAFAEYAAVPERNLIELPRDMSFDRAALLEPAAVALHAVRRLTREVRSAAVVGDGAIGRLIARWLTLRGVAEVALLGRRDAPARETYDACFEAVGTADAFRRCVGLAKPNGGIVLVGNPDADFGTDTETHRQILRGQITVRGSWNSSFPADWERVIACADELRLGDLIGRRYAFSELGEAFVALRDKAGVRGKVVVL